jgi:methyltransferase-like protein
VAGADEIAQASRVLGQSLLKCHLADLVELHTRPADFVTRASDRPVAAAAARAQAASSRVVTNRRHETVRLDDVSRHILPLLDGTRGRQDLLELLETSVEEGVLSVYPAGGDDQVPEDVGASLAGALENSLSDLAASALLIG